MQYNTFAAVFYGVLFFVHHLDSLVRGGIENRFVVWRCTVSSEGNSATIEAAALDSSATDAYRSVAIDGSKTNPLVSLS